VGYDDLTPSELRVLTLIAAGCTQRQMTDVGGWSPHTIQAQRKALKWKLGATTLAEAVAIGFRRGLLS
jgi:DNA-binding NarL/FixJ family response regulator